MNSTEPAPKPGSIQVLHRAAALLDVLAEARRPVSLTQLARAVGLNKSTVLNILATMASLGLVFVDPETRQYRLGPKVLRLGSAFEASFSIADVAKPALVATRDVTGETASLHVRVGSERTCIAQEQGVHPLRRVIELGRKRPLYSGSAGFVLLAELTDEDVLAYLDRVEIIPFTQNTLTDRDRLLTVVRGVRRDGYSAVFEDTEPGAAAVGVPIRDHSDAVRAVLVVSGPSIRFDRKAIADAVPFMQRQAADVSRQLGWLSPQDPAATAVSS
ncbi:MAG: IclR family transcriptional regulator [Vulcanimicrobiaceae bacterium]|jgi:DNA-binding IclR family transcriptional regulator